MSNDFGGMSGGHQSATWQPKKLILNTKISIKYINFSI